MESKFMATLLLGKRCKWRRSASWISGCGWIALTLACGVTFCLPERTQAATGGTRRAALEPDEDLEKQITELIEQLGAEQFARRERAQEQLHALGLVAFDALLEACRHPDVEIALRARYLIRSMPLQWSSDSDPPTVKSILANYSHMGRGDRLARMQHLNALPQSAGIPALCRLMRFESDGLLSKQAALYVMSHTASDDRDERSELAASIEATVGLSKRPAAVWLRTYANTLRDPASTVEEWEQIASEEERKFAQFPERTDRMIVRDLFRWQADMLREIDQEEDFLKVIHRMLDLIEGDRTELFDIVDWALEREAWSVVDEVANRYPGEFYKDAILVYRLAEAQLRRGEKDLADKSAERALRIAPEQLDTHNLHAEFLMSRMLYEWAEQEYRFVIANTTPTPNDGLHLEARFFLSDMLYDLQEYAGAAEVLKGAVDQIETNAKILQPTLRTAAEVRGTLYYYQAMQDGERGEIDSQKDRLREAYKIYPSNPDFLIALYRVNDDSDSFRAEVTKRLDAATGRLRDRIQAYDSVLQNPRNETERLEMMDLLARSSNELAWLISNTEGDFAAAVQYSRRSLQLKPDSAAYLDTLGRCYYAAGDFANAVKYQKRAVARAPFLQQIRRQLELFEEALAQSGSSTPQS